MIKKFKNYCQFFLSIDTLATIVIIVALLATISFFSFFVVKTCYEESVIATGK
jgi:hypothetical protein